MNKNAQAKNWRAEYTKNADNCLLFLSKTAKAKNRLLFLGPRGKGKCVKVKYNMKKRN